MRTKTFAEPIVKPAAFNLREAARYLSVSEPAFRDLLKTGEIPHRKAGRRYLIAPDALDAWLKGGTPKDAAK